MRKIKEVLRLRFELGLGQREIARACSISQGAVHNYLKKAAAAGICWPLPEGWDEKRIEQALFGEQRAIERLPRTSPSGFSRPALAVAAASPSDAAVGLGRVPADASGRIRLQPLLRAVPAVAREAGCGSSPGTPPGEKGFVDWAGATIPVHDPVTGEVWPASLFVMVLGASSYTYAEATRDQQLTAWISAHIHAFEYFGGVPRLLVPDNLRTGVSRACRYDPDLNPTYQELAMHYGVGVVPARPYRPRDKAKVEVGVQVVERWIIAALRHQKFFRLADLNHAIRELLERLNQRPFRKREGSRASVFAAVERNALRALPAEPFDMSQWSYARVNIDYHIAFDANLYSVPYTLVQERVEVRATPTTIEIFHKGQRVASHVRGHGPRTSVHAERTPAEESPSTSGVDALTHGELGRTDRTAHGQVVRTDPGRKTASGDGLSILPRDHPAGRTVLRRQDGSGCRSSHTDRCLPLPEREIDPEELARPATTPRTATASSSASHDNIRGAEYFE